MPGNQYVALTELKLKKLAEQKLLSDQLNRIFTRTGGLNETSTLQRKNLEVAVAVSKRPGFFELYQPSAEIKRIEESGEVGLLAKKINKMQREIDAVDADLRKAKGGYQPPRELAEPTMSSLSQWFATYGQPKPAPNNFMSEFQPSPKIYGGTAHHRAFKTLSKSMKRGHLTR